MNIVHSWLQDYLRFSLTPEVIADRLGKLGLEVASVERPGEKFKGFVVGEVVACDRHPKADRLTVCRVNVGKEVLQIVCGAPNVAPGQKVAVGLVGSIVPRNQHDPGGKPFELSRVVLRGVESSGMICSEYELDLGSEADGILVLDADAKVGRSLASHFGLDDVVYDIEVTANRPDWLSHLGVAREIGILVKKEPRPHAVKLEEGKTSIRKFLSITVKDRENCPRFAGRMIRGVTIGPSPVWLQQRLRNAGLRPINNVVDVTNYVMYETGHPLHAFDYALLKGGKIIVRQAPPGTQFTTLDGKQHDLPVGAVMVCDGEREVSIAGIMGGENSEIRDSTKDVVLESAYWRPSSIRRSAKALGITTDASMRFERGADPNGVEYALDRAAELLLMLAGGELLRGKIDVYPKKIRPRVVPLRVERVNSVLGSALTKKEIVSFLSLLGIGVREKSSGLLTCKVPTYRVDIEREIDLIEEIARIYGYDKIKPRTSASIALGQIFPSKSLADTARDILSGAGFAEALNGSMLDEPRARLAGVEPARILNPLGQDMAYLRTSLIPGLLDTVRQNQNYGNPDLRFFEIGHVFWVDPTSGNRLIENYVEEERVALLLTGEAAPRQWSTPARKSDMYDLKGAVASFVEKLSLDKARFISYSTSDGLTESTLSIEIHGGYAGSLGRVREDILPKLGVEGDVFIAELLLSALAPRKVRSYEQLPKFPKVLRDISLFVDRGVHVGDIEERIRSAGGELLVGGDLFDVYEGEKAPEGKKSLAFSLALMSRQKTLTDAEIEAAVRRVVEALERDFGATLRSVK
jgi:phenylalanyl-tRNA synthetase beta chain